MSKVKTVMIEKIFGLGYDETSAMLKRTIVTFSDIEEAKRQCNMDEPELNIKAHIDVGAASDLVHTVAASAGMESDVTLGHAGLHGAEVATFCRRSVSWCSKTGRAPRQIRGLSCGNETRQTEGTVEEATGLHYKKLRHPKASVRGSRASIRVTKNLFRYWELHNSAWQKTTKLFTLFGFANLVLAVRRFTTTKPQIRHARRKAQIIVQFAEKAR